MVSSPTISRQFRSMSRDETADIASKSNEAWVPLLAPHACQDNIALITSDPGGIEEALSATG